MERRIKIRTEVDNLSSEELYDTWYTATINKEAQPYFADGIIEYKQNKTHIYTKEKAQKAVSDNKLGKDGKPITWGFIYEGKLLATTDEDLKTYNNLSFDGIYDAVKSIEIKIHWRGGSQTITLPLTLKDEE